MKKVIVVSALAMAGVFSARLWLIGVKQAFM